MFAVKTKMVFNKRSDKKGAVIVARLKPDMHRIITKGLYSPRVFMTTPHILLSP
jgi:hypothetical protein